MADKIEFLPSTSAACCDTNSKSLIEGCAGGVSYIVMLCDSDCGLTTSLTYINMSTGSKSTTPPSDFVLGNCTDKTFQVACKPYMETESFIASAGQTTFTIANAASGDVRFSRNGSTLTDNAATVSGSTVTYVVSPNNNEPLLAGDRIDITYIYSICDQTVEPFVNCIGEEILNGAALVTCEELDPNDFTIDPVTGNITINSSVVIQGSDCITVEGSGTVLDPYIIGSTSCGSTESCPTQFKDVVLLPGSGSVVINHNLDLVDPYAFLLTHYNLNTGLIGNISITNVTANSFTIENNSATMAIDYVVNVQKNEPCDVDPELDCNYQYISAVNTTQTLANGTIATVSGSTGDDYKTFQGITGWNVGDLEDDEKITTTFSAPIKRVRFIIDTVERKDGQYEQVKLFINGAPYAIKASELISPINSGGKLNIIDGGFTLDPSVGADDASAVVVIDYPAGINSIAVQDIRVTGAPNGATVRLEVKECI
jgi:hypothetical protein